MVVETCAEAFVMSYKPLEPREVEIRPIRDYRGVWGLTRARIGRAFSMGAVRNVGLRPGYC